jgi:hypothetical protein
MKNSKSEPEYVIRYRFEWLSVCFWAVNDATEEEFGNPIDPEELPLSQNTIQWAKELADWHNGALNWDYPPDPGPWRQEECDRFNRAAKELLITVRQELGEHFEVIDARIEEREDPDLYAYLRDPEGFRRET